MYGLAFIMFRTELDLTSVKDYTDGRKWFNVSFVE